VVIIAILLVPTANTVHRPTYGLLHGLNLHMEPCAVKLIPKLRPVLDHQLPHPLPVCTVPVYEPRFPFADRLVGTGSR
jgi:hypothetical protein